MNKNKKNLFTRLSVVVLTIIVILLVWDGCNQKARLSAYKKQINKLEITNQSFEEKFTKDGKKIVEQEQLILSQKDAIKNNLLALNGMKKVQSQVRIKSVFQVDSIFVPYTDTFIVEKTNYKSFGFALNNDKYSIVGKTKESGILLDSISFNNNLSVTIGNKSKGFFRASQPIVAIEYENPYVNTKSMQNIVIKNDIKWWDRKGTWLTIGLLGGLVGGIFLIK
jgi:hypothetical protein